VQVGDSGASHQIAPRRDYFVKIYKIDLIKIRTVSGAEYTADHAGSTRVTVMAIEYGIHYVLFAPWATRNILSVRVLTGKGYEVRFDPNVGIDSVSDGRLVVR